MTAITMSTKGQVVIPKEIRDQVGLAAGDRVEVRVEGNAVVLERAPRVPAGEGWRRWRGLLRGAAVLDQLEREHCDEVARDERLP